MSQPFVGEVRIFAGNFAPQGWALCNGQLLAIVQNTALFSLIGTAYGGNGVTTFGLPDLRGRVPLHPGQGPGLSNRDWGEAGGGENVTLAEFQIPSHTHTFAASMGNGVSDSPTGRFPARNPADIPQHGATPDASLAASAAGASGGGQPHNNMQPYLVVNYIIALQGIFPPRS